MGERFDRAAALDRPLAERWRAQTKENLTRELTRADIEFIMGPLFRGKSEITEKHSQAIFILFEGMTFKHDATRLFVALVEKADRRFSRAALTEQELAEVSHALGNGVVGKILFKSPGTQIAYAPFDYRTVAELIVEKRVSVFRSPRLAALASRAKYNTVTNQLVLKDSTDPTARLTTIVHEATHVIQDWWDLPTLIHDEEADCFLAERIASSALGRATGTTNPVWAESTVAADLVLRGKADDRNLDWITAYKKLQEATGRFYKMPGLRSIVEKKKKPAEAERETYSLKRGSFERWDEFIKELQKQLHLDPVRKIKI